MLDVQNQCHSGTNKIPEKYHSLNTAHFLTHQWHSCLNSNYWPGGWNVKFTVLKDIYVDTAYTKASNMYNAPSNKFFKSGGKKHITANERKPIHQLNIHILQLCSLLYWTVTSLNVHLVQTQICDCKDIHYRYHNVLM